MSAVARYETIATSSVNGRTNSIRGMRILISDKANACSARHFARATMLDVAVRGESVKAGTYTVIDAVERTADNGEAEATFNALDGTCEDVVAQAATGGTVTITQADTRVTGTIDVTFRGGRVSGAFDAELCPEARPDSTSGGTCTP